MAHASTACSLVVSLLLLGPPAARACQRDESMPATLPLTARTRIAVSSLTAPVAEAAAASQPLIGADAAAVAPLLVATPSLTFTRHDLDSSPYGQDRKSTRLNSSHVEISYAVFCLKKKKKKKNVNKKARKIIC